MTTDETTQAERRGGTQALISKLLEDRKRLLVLYEKVAGIGPYTEGLPSAQTLREFSQLLVDYIAAGHFGLYERIAEGQERRRKVIEAAEQVYRRIAQTTEIAMAFNDTYEASGKEALTGELAAQLPKLGETIANRIELEDAIIGQMMA